MTDKVGRLKKTLLGPRQKLIPRVGVRGKEKDYHLDGFLKSSSNKSLAKPRWRRQNMKEQKGNKLSQTSTCCKQIYGSPKGR